MQKFSLLWAKMQKWSLTLIVMFYTLLQVNPDMVLQLESAGLCYSVHHAFVFGDRLEVTLFKTLSSFIFLFIRSWSDKLFLLKTCFEILSSKKKKKLIAQLKGSNFKSYILLSRMIQYEQVATINKAPTNILLFFIIFKCHQ